MCPGFFCVKGADVGVSVGVGYVVMYFAELQRLSTWVSNLGAGYAHLLLILRGFLSFFLESGTHLCVMTCRCYPNLVSRTMWKVGIRDQRFRDQRFRDRGKAFGLCMRSEAYRIKDHR